MEEHPVSEHVRPAAAPLPEPPQPARGRSCKPRAGTATGPDLPRLRNGLRWGTARTFSAIPCPEPEQRARETAGSSLLRAPGPQLRKPRVPFPNTPRTPRGRTRARAGARRSPRGGGALLPLRPSRGRHGGRGRAARAAEARRPRAGRGAAPGLQAAPRRARGDRPLQAGGHRVLQGTGAGRAGRSGPAGAPGRVWKAAALSGCSSGVFQAPLWMRWSGECPDPGSAVLSREPRARRLRLRCDSRGQGRSGATGHGTVTSGASCAPHSLFYT